MMHEIDYNMSLADLQNCDDDELYHVFMYSDRDREELFCAACTYFMCVMEINCRNEEELPKCLDLKCISNTFDSDHEVVFRLGNKYRMYAIDDTMLVYDDNWIPYIFTIIEGDNRCIWRYFTLWEYDWRESSYLS